MTQGGLKAMEELAKLEDERGNPGYMHADGIITSGGAEMAGGKKGKQERIASNEMCTFFDFEYFFPAVDTGEYDCVQKPVWQCEPGRDYCAGNCGDVCQYVDGGGVL